MTLTLPARVRAQQQVRRALAPSTPRLVRRFTAWMGVDIPAHYQSVAQLAAAVESLNPAGAWDELELLLKAGEGGSWQSNFDPHPLAVSGPAKLGQLIDEAQPLGLRITPYVVVRARPDWIGGETVMINQCVAVAGRCVLNVEPGALYYNGPNDPSYIRNYLRGCDVPASTLEVCLIPRAAQVEQLGGRPCVEAWTDPNLIGGASWETYGLAAPGYGATSLQVDAAIPRLDSWGVPQDPRFRIPVVQRDERNVWAPTIWAAGGLAVWWLDGS